MVKFRVVSVSYNKYRLVLLGEVNSDTMMVGELWEELLVMGVIGGIIEHVSDFEGDSEHDSGVEKNKEVPAPATIAQVNGETNAASSSKRKSEEEAEEKAERKRRRRAEKKAKKEKVRLEMEGMTIDTSNNVDPSEEFQSESKLKKKKNKKDIKSLVSANFSNILKPDLQHLQTPKPKEKQMKGLDDTHEEEDNDDKDEEVDTRERKGRKSQEENKENGRSKSGKRARNLDDSFDLNIVVMEDMVKGLIKHRDGWPFDRPITKAVAPDYHHCVRHPMDLDTIRHRLNDMFYTSNQAIINDIRLVFSNCLSYNMEDAEEYGCAERLEKFFDAELKAQGLVDKEAFKPKSTKRRL